LTGVDKKPSVGNVSSGQTIYASKGNEIIGQVNNSIKNNEGGTITGNLNVTGNLQKSGLNVITNLSGGTAITSIIRLTQAQYNAATKYSDVLYIIVG
jgi:hypothetical protein